MVRDRVRVTAVPSVGARGWVWVWVWVWGRGRGRGWGRVRYRVTCCAICCASCEALLRGGRFTIGDGPSSC